MLERIWKLAFTLALVLGVLAIILFFTGGSYSHQSTGNSGFRIDIGLGTDSGSLSMILGIISIAMLILGATFLVFSKQAQHNDKARALGEFLQKLHRSESDCKVAGVCGGLADGTPIPSWAWRMLFLVLTFCFGIGLVPYIILWICFPVRQVQAS
jgi:phage shock protein C